MRLLLLPTSLATEEIDIADRWAKDPAELNRIWLSLALPSPEFEIDIALPLPKESDKSLRDLYVHRKRKTLNPKCVVGKTTTSLVAPWFRVYLAQTAQVYVQHNTLSPVHKL